MARRRNTQENPTTDVDEASPEYLDESVEADETAEEQDATSEDVEEAPVEEVTTSNGNGNGNGDVDLTQFTESVEAALQSRDEASGKLTDEAVEHVNTQYRSLDGLKAKNKARSSLDEAMKAAIRDKDIIKAQAYVDLKEGLSAGAGGGAAKAPTDPTEAFVSQVAAFQLANTYLISNPSEGVEEGWEDKVDPMVAELQSQFDAWAEYQNNDDDDAEAPEVSPVVRAAFKLTQGKAARGGGVRASGGPRRDIGAHLAQVFANEEVDKFLTVNQIAKTKTTEYPDGDCSPGAVNARLFPKDKPAYDDQGIRGEIPDTGARGARKYAEAEEAAA